MLNVLFTSLIRVMTENQYVINEDENKVSSCCQWVYLTINQELGVLKQPVHDSWECGWFIGVAKRQYSELRVAR